MSNPLANLQSCVSGKYRVETLESPLLARLREQAVSEAYGSGALGRLPPWYRLTSEELAVVEPRLVELVAVHREELEATAVPIFDTGWLPNLILDVGLDAVCVDPVYGWFNEATLGTGTTATVYDPGSVTATASGTGCTASSSFFTAAMEGMLIHWDSGEEAYIRTYNTGTSVTLASSTTASGAFAVHAVNRTGPASVSVTKVVTADPTFTLASGVSTQSKTWVFDLETTNKVYTEGAIRRASSGAYWSVFLISGGSVTVEIGQQARMSYSISTSVTTTSVPGTWTMSTYDSGAPGGWDSTDGDGQILTLVGLGSTVVGTTLAPGEAGGGHDIGTLTSRTTMFTYADSTYESNTGVLGGVRGTAASYLSGTFYRDSTYYFPAATYNTTAIRSFVLTADGGYVMWQFLFDTAKTLDFNHSLSLTLRRSLRRVITNP